MKAPLSPLDPPQRPRFTWVPAFRIPRIRPDGFMGVWIPEWRATLQPAGGNRDHPHRRYRGKRPAPAGLVRFRASATMVITFGSFAGISSSPGRGGHSPCLIGYVALRRGNPGKISDYRATHRVGEPEPRQRPAAVKGPAADAPVVGRGAATCPDDWTARIGHGETHPVSKPSLDFGTALHAMSEGHDDRNSLLRYTEAESSRPTKNLRLARPEGTS